MLGNRLIADRLVEDTPIETKRESEQQLFLLHRSCHSDALQQIFLERLAFRSVHASSSLCRERLERRIDLLAGLTQR